MLPGLGCGIRLRFLALNSIASLFALGMKAQAFSPRLPVNSVFPKRMAPVSRIFRGWFHGDDFRH